MVDVTAESCVLALLSGWVSRFGVPSTISSEGRQQFHWELWHALKSLLPPQANDIVERFHRHLETGLKARLAGSLGT